VGVSALLLAHTQSSTTAKKKGRELQRAPPQLFFPLFRVEGKLPKAKENKNQHRQKFRLKDKKRE
jgi:hypothetical protein